MGKKGNWITALKKAFITNPNKDKPTNVLVAQYQQPPPAQYRSSERDKKRWGFGRSRQHADPSAPAMPGGAGALMSIPLYRQPSSIEKILGDAEMERQYYGRPPAQYQITPARPTTTTVAAATAPTTPSARDREPERKRDAGEKQQQQYAAAVLPLPLPPPQACSPPPLIRRFDHDREQQQRLHRLQQGRAAEKITEWRQPQQQQRPMTNAAASRRRAVPPEQARAAAVAIQAAFRGYSARRSYRSLRGLIRLQGVVRGPSVRRQTAHAMRCMRTLVRVQAKVRASRVEAMERRSNRHGAMFRDGRSRGGSQQDGGMWDDSLLSRDEADSRTKRKAEAVMKRERALAYAYSHHQVLKATPMAAAHAILADLQSGRNPWWWSPIDRTHQPNYPRHVDPIVVRHRPAPASIARRETMTPMMMTPMTTAAYYPKHPSSSSSRPVTRAATTRGGGGAPGSHVRDDESLTSCPAFGVPNYMTPTLSASAKARARAQMLHQQLDKERRAAEQKPRFSFGLGQSIGSWAKSPFWKAGAGGGDPSRAGVAGGRRHRRSVSGLSVDSTVSMPAGVGRRTFK